MRIASRFLAATVALGAALLGSAAANANPITFYYSLDGNSYTPFGTTTTGSGQANTTVGNYTIQASAIGSPVLTAPNLQSTTLDISSSTAGTLFVAVAESGLTTPALTGFTLGLTSNLGATTPVTGTFAIIDSNGVYKSLSSMTLAPNSTQTSFAPFVPTPNYTAVELYAATFGASGGVVNATFSETGVFSVPEPVSISMLGASLAGVGLIRLRRKS